MKLLSNIIIFSILGLAVGYFIFARFNNAWIPVGDLFKIYESGIFGQAFSGADNLLRGTSVIRQKILISGGVGVVIGLLSFTLFFSRKSSKRRR